MEQATGFSQEQVVAALVERWKDPVLRIEDTFNVRRADGGLTKMILPEPHKPIIRDGPLGKAVNYPNSGYVFSTANNKCRQAGFSVLTAAEMILVQQDWPNTNLYYIAPVQDNVKDFCDKFTQLATDANHYPSILGGGSILKNVDTSNVFTKRINGAYMFGLPAMHYNIRGKTGIYVVFDEMDWAIRYAGQMKETKKVIDYYVRQGGWVRYQSTPRAKDSEFGAMCNEPDKHGVKYYECPVISNWKQLDMQEPLYIDINNKRRLMKQMKVLTDDEIVNLIRRYKDKPQFNIDYALGEIRQKAIIPYPWVTLEDLESKRSSDLEAFMQENLCVPIDESYKLLKTEWIYNNITDGELDSRGNSTNTFFMTIDLGQIKDLTAITTTEIMPSGEIFERNVDETQEPYPNQVELIWGKFMAFRPSRIAIDNTGHGIVIGDLLEKKLRENGFSTDILVRITFTNTLKEEMALGFKDLVSPPNSKYKFLNQTTVHERAIRHCMRIEKEVTDTCVRYSGKMHGRDDHFWSKALLVKLLNTNMAKVKSSIGGYHRKLIASAKPHSRSGAHGQEVVDELHRLRAKAMEDSTKPAEEAPARKFFTNITKLDSVIDELYHQKVLCLQCSKMTNMLEIAGCQDPGCHEKSEMLRICRRHNVTPDEVWDRQLYYKEGEKQNDGEVPPLQ